MRRLRAHHGPLMKLNQRSRAQSRSKSGAVATVRTGAVAGEKDDAGFSGSVQATSAKVRKEIWFCARVGAGTAGADFESVEEWTRQQSQWPHIAAHWSGDIVEQHGDVIAAAGAGANCAPSSNTLNKMATNRFITFAN
jgi:hypothetical protein